MSKKHKFSFGQTVYTLVTDEPGGPYISKQEVIGMIKAEDDSFGYFTRRSKTNERVDYCYREDELFASVDDLLNDLRETEK